MAETKQLRIEAGLEAKPTAKMQEVLKNIQKNWAIAFDSKYLKNTNKEIANMEKMLAKVGQSSKLLGKVFKENAEIQKKGALEAVKAWEGATKLAERQAKFMSDPRNLNRLYDTYLRQAQRDAPPGIAYDAQAEARARLDRFRQQALGNISGVGNTAAALAENQRSIELAEKQRMYRRLLTGAMIGQAAIGVGNAVANTWGTWEISKMRNQAADVGAAGNYYNALVGGDLGLAAKLMDPAALARARDASVAAGRLSYWQSGSSIAGGGISGVMGVGKLAVAGVPGGIFLGAGNDFSSSANGIAGGIQGFGTDAARAARARAYSEAIELTRTLDPVKQRALQELGTGSMATANQIARFGGFDVMRSGTAKYDNTPDVVKPGHTMSTTGMGLGERAHLTQLEDQDPKRIRGGLNQFGMNWRSEMALFAGLAGQFGSQNAAAMMNRVGGAEQIFGISGQSAAGAIGAGVMAGGGAQGSIDRFERTMAKAVTLGIKDAKMKEDIASIIAQYENSPTLGRMAGGGTAMADLFLMQMKGREGDVGYSQVVAGGMAGAEGTTTAGGGFQGLMNRRGAVNAVNAELARVNAARRKQGLKPIVLSQAERYGLIQLATESGVSSLASGQNPVMDQILQAAEQRANDGAGYSIKPNSSLSSGRIVGSKYRDALNLNSTLLRTNMSREKFFNAVVANDPRVQGDLIGWASGVADTQGLKLDWSQKATYGRSLITAMKEQEAGQEVPPEVKKQLDAFEASSKQGAQGAFADAARAQATAFENVLTQMNSPQVQSTVKVLGDTMGTMASEVGKAAADGLEAVAKALKAIADTAPAAGAVLGQKRAR